MEEEKNFDICAKPGKLSSRNECGAWNIFRLLFEGIASQCPQIRPMTNCQSLIFISESLQFCNTTWNKKRYKRTDGSTSEF